MTAMREKIGAGSVNTTYQNSSRRCSISSALTPNLHMLTGHHDLIRTLGTIGHAGQETIFCTTLNPAKETDCFVCVYSTDGR